MMPCLKIMFPVTEMKTNVTGLKLCIFQEIEKFTQLRLLAFCVDKLTLPDVIVNCEISASDFEDYDVTR